MSSNENVIEVQNLSKCYEIYDSPRARLKQLFLPTLFDIANRLGSKLGICSRKPRPCYFKEFWALRNVSFSIKSGETFGIIGRNGSGKSTLLQILAGTLAPTQGEVRVNGRVAALLELGSGFNLEFTGRENVLLNGRILGLSQQDIEARYDEIVRFADIGEFIDQPVKTYSSGMFVRLAFAVQAHIDASIVIIDEALAVGDVFFRQKCYARLEELRKSGAAILLVTHAMTEVEQFCDRAILLDHGRTGFLGYAVEATKHYYMSQQLPTHSSQRETQSIKIKKNNQRESVGKVRCPDPRAFIDLRCVRQIGTGIAECTSIAICNMAGEPCNVFQQGERAVFYVEYKLTQNIGVPICGIVIANDHGVLVHGKNAWQYHDNTITGHGSGNLVMCRQEIELWLAQGEYTIEFGLASVAESDWEMRSMLSHDDWNLRHRPICVVPNAGVIAIGLAVENGVGKLTHHGVADLPGSIATCLIDVDE